MALGVLKQIFKTSGKQAILELVNRQYDFRIQPNEVDIVIYEPETSTVESAMQIPEFDEVTMRTAIITPTEGSRFHGKTFLQYDALDTRRLQLDEVMTINVRVPVTIEQVIDQLELKYGFRMEVSDLGKTSKDVLASVYGECVVVIPNTSLRFCGSWKFVFLNTDQVDLASVVPSARTGDVGDLYNIAPATGMV